MGKIVRTLLVEAPGLLTTVQDLGRMGYGPMGISASGAADPVALQLANLLVGNARGAAALEMTLSGGRLPFPQGAVVALGGSDFSAVSDGQSLRLWIPHAIAPGSTISFGGTRTGARCYLGVAGGIHVEPFLGSASTHLVSGLGGYAGRALRKGDVLQLGEPEKSIWRRKLVPELIRAWEPRKTLRVTPGPQADWFPKATRKLFADSSFTVMEDSDRLGLRLLGPALNSAGSHEMITEGVTLGAIQVTPSGQAIILFVEQQTTGGYPKIANVIGADRTSLGQLRPRDEVRFEMISLEEARALWIEHQALLKSAEKQLT
jgi:antagonist of KipI